MCTEDGCQSGRCGLSRPVLAPPSVVAAALPTLGTVVAVTSNSTALLSHTGSYLPPALPGGALHCASNRIGLRVDAAYIDETFVTPRALTLSGPAGAHRAYLTPVSDQLALHAIELAPAGAAAGAGPAGAPEIADDQIALLDSLCGDRFHALPMLESRRIEPRVITHLLTHLTEIGLPYTLAVPGGGCVQLHRGASALVDRSGPGMLVTFTYAQYAFDPAWVVDCWVSRVHGATGLTSVIELYDRNGQVVTALTQTGLVCAHVHGQWEQIAASLPGC